MATAPTILSPRQPFVDIVNNKGTITREWFRFLNSLGDVAGTASQPVTVAPNNIVNNTTIVGGDTLTFSSIPSDTLLGNATGATDVPGAVPLDLSLAIENGSLAVAPLAALTLFGNSTTVEAVPTEIELSSDFSMMDGTLYATTSTSGQAAAMAYWGF